MLLNLFRLANVNGVVNPLVRRLGELDGPPPRDHPTAQLDALHIATRARHKWLQGVEDNYFMRFGPVTIEHIGAVFRADPIGSLQN